MRSSIMSLEQIPCLVPILAYSLTCMCVDFPNVLLSWRLAGRSERGPRPDEPGPESEAPGSLGSVPRSATINGKVVRVHR